jgi:hypothetical protein
LGIIVVGIVLIFRAALTRSLTESDTNRYQSSGGNQNANTEGTSSEGNAENIINVSTIFGNTKKNILTKNFKGGQSTVLFGGTELDLTHADVNGVAVIDGMVAFGGLEIVVPSNWDVQSEMSVILGGIEDKRSRLSDVDPTKRLILKGTCMFGGVEIKSY